MITFRFAELVREDGSVQRLRYPVAAEYRENLKKNLRQLAEDIKHLPDEPSHFNFHSTQLNRHLRHGETTTQFLPRRHTDAQVQLTPFLRWKIPELRGGQHFTSCLCTKRNGMQVWCPRWGCRGALRCAATHPGAPVTAPRLPDDPVEPTCHESWLQRAKEADMQLHLVKTPVVIKRGLY